MDKKISKFNSWSNLSLDEREKRIKKAKKKRKKTNLTKFGVENPSQLLSIREKRTQTFLDKYGVLNPFQAEEVKEKIKQTCLERYGVEYSLQSPEVRDKGKQTCMEKYGVGNPSQNFEIKEKGKNIKLQKYGDKYYNNREKFHSTHQQNFYIKLFQSNRLKNLITPLFSLEEYKCQKNNTGHLFYKFQCNKCGLEFEASLANGQIPRCFKCYPVSNFTIPHKIICEYLDSQNISYEVEKFISPYRVDIFIEPNKVIEIYGDYWHGNPKFYKEGDSLNLPTGKIKVEEKWEKDKNREEYLKKQGYEILTIWEDDILNDLKGTLIKIKLFLKKINKGRRII